MGIDVQRGRSIDDVVDQVVAGKYVQPGWDVHSVFQANRDIIQVILGGFRDEIKLAEPVQSFPVPIVLLAMNAVEAQELASGAAFCDYPVELRTDFERLQALLSENGVADWQRRYRETPEAWQPFSSANNAENITHLVVQALDPIQRAERQFAPSFQDIRTLSDASNRRLLGGLRRNGCVVIMDCISMRHPAIQRAFQQSALDAYPSTSMVAIAPIHSMFEVMRQMTIMIRLCISDMEFAKRRGDLHEEFGACIEVCDRQELQHWLVDRVRKLYPSEVATQTGIRAFMYKDIAGARS